MPYVPKHSGLIFDVGMHKGEDTDYYLKKGFKVVGFEADPDLVALCKNRFCNELVSGKLQILEGAIVEPNSRDARKSTVRFHRNTDVSVWGTVRDDWALRNEQLGTSNESVDVPVVDFTQSIELYGIPYYLKIDVEGMDIACLRALLGFEQRPNYVSIESEKISFGKLQAEFDLFEQLGYGEFKAIEQSSIWRQIEPNPSAEGSYLGYQFERGSSGMFGEDLPGDWKFRRQILSEYRIIFALYKLFGDYGLLGRSFLVTQLRKALSALFGRPVPGWYDTHAKHSSLSTPHLTE